MKQELTNNEETAFSIISEKFNKEYNELYDSLYYYVLTYIEKDSVENELFRDEVENYLNIRSHKDIINYILRL